jgi:TonB family protein
MQTVPAGYISTRSVGGVTYGQPKELAAIRRRLTPLCTGGRNLTDLGGHAVASELIQIGHYAIAEGGCGNPELHLILKKTHGLWQRGKGCGLGGGVSPDYGTYGVYKALVNCSFPVPVVCRIIAIRSEMPIFAQEKPKGAEKACLKYSSAPTSKPTPATSNPTPATSNSTPMASNANPASPTPPPCARPHMDALITRVVEPDYPKSAREQGVTGTVLVRVSLDPSGGVMSTSIYKSSGNAELDQAALAAAHESTYSPEIEDCQPVRGTYLFRASFSKS